MGAITDEEGRTLDVPLSLLTPGRRYVAEVYADGPNALHTAAACTQVGPGRSCIASQVS